jgi:hypothetical protein
MTLHQDHPGGGRAVRNNKRRSIAEQRREKESAAARLEAARIRTMIERFEMDIFGLDTIIKAELESSAVSDPWHFAFPISLRMMMAQRDNLAATAAMLSERLEIVTRIGSHHLGH